MRKAIEAIVCNVCEDITRPTRSYQVRGPGLSFKTDLCDEHSDCLRELAETGEPLETEESRSRRKQRKVMTMQEIEELKRKRR